MAPVTATKNTEGVPHRSHHAHVHPHPGVVPAAAPTDVPAVTTDTSTAQVPADPPVEAVDAPKSISEVPAASVCVD